VLAGNCLGPRHSVPFFLVWKQLLLLRILLDLEVRFMFFLLFAWKLLWNGFDCVIAEVMLKRRVPGCLIGLHR
jgi:hypothetical protein